MANKIIDIIAVCILFYSCTAQKNSGVYAYRQPVLQGARPTAIADEKGRTVERPMRESANFFIYIESPSANIEVKELWIKKKPYVAKVETVASTPVVLKTTIGPNASDTLVKRTSNTVLQLTPREESTMRTLSSSMQKKISENELVVYCVVDGKDRYYTLATIKNLPPVALQ